MRQTKYRMTDVQGYPMLDDGPRFPILPTGHVRVHCPWCLVCADAPTSAEAHRQLNAHATAKHGWLQGEV